MLRIFQNQHVKSSSHEYSYDTVIILLSFSVITSLLNIIVTDASSVQNDNFKEASKGVLQVSSIYSRPLEIEREIKRGISKELLKNVNLDYDTHCTTDTQIKRPKRLWTFKRKTNHSMVSNVKPLKKMRKTNKGRSRLNHTVTANPKENKSSKIHLPFIQKKKTAQSVTKDGSPGNKVHQNNLRSNVSLLNTTKGLKYLARIEMTTNENLKKNSIEKAIINSTLPLIKSALSQKENLLSNLSTPPGEFLSTSIPGKNNIINSMAKGYEFILTNKSATDFCVNIKVDKSSMGIKVDHQNQLPQGQFDLEPFPTESFSLRKNGSSNLSNASNNEINTLIPDRHMPTSYSKTKSYTTTFTTKPKEYCKNHLINSSILADYKKNNQTNITSDGLDSKNQNVAINPTTPSLFKLSTRPLKLTLIEIGNLDDHNKSTDTYWRNFTFTCYSEDSGTGAVLVKFPLIPTTPQNIRKIPITKSKQVLPEENVSSVKTNDLKENTTKKNMKTDRATVSILSTINSLQSKNVFNNETPTVIVSNELSTTTPWKNASEKTISFFSDYIDNEELNTTFSGKDGKLKPASFQDEKNQCHLNPSTEDVIIYKSKTIIRLGSNSTLPSFLSKLNFSELIGDFDITTPCFSNITV